MKEATGMGCSQFSRVSETAFSVKKLANNYRDPCEFQIFTAKTIFKCDITACFI